MAEEAVVGRGSKRPSVSSLALPEALIRRRPLPNPLTVSPDTGKIAASSTTIRPMSPRLPHQNGSKGPDVPRPMPKRRSTTTAAVVTRQSKSKTPPPPAPATKPKPPPPSQPPPPSSQPPPVQSPSKAFPRFHSLPNLPSRVQSPPAESPVQLPRYQPPSVTPPGLLPPGKLPSGKPPTPTTSPKPVPSAKPAMPAKPHFAAKPRLSMDLTNVANETPPKNRRMSAGWELAAARPSPSTSRQKLLSPNVSAPKLLDGADSPRSSGSDIRRSRGSSPALIGFHSRSSSGVGSSGDGEIGRTASSPVTSVGDGSSRSSSRHGEPMADAPRQRARAASSASPQNLQAQMAMCALAATRFRRMPLPPLTEPPLVPLCSKPTLPPEPGTVSACSDNKSDDIVFSEDEGDANSLYDTVPEILRDDILNGRVGSTLPPASMQAVQIAGKPPIGSSTLPKSFRDAVEQPIQDQGYVCPIRPTTSSLASGSGQGVDIEPIYDADGLADGEPIYDADSPGDDENIYDAAVEQDFPPPPPMMLGDECPEIPEESEVAEANEAIDAFGDAEDVEEASDHEWDEFDEEGGELTYETTDACIEERQSQAAEAISQPPPAVSLEAEAAEKSSQGTDTLDKKTLKTLQKFEKKEQKLRQKQQEKEEAKRKKAEQERMKTLNKLILQQKKRFKITGNEEVEQFLRANFSCKSCPEDYLLYDGGDVFEVINHKSRVKAKVSDDCWLVRRKRDGTYGMVEKLNMTPIDQQMARDLESEARVPPPLRPVSPLSGSYQEDDIYDNGEEPDEVEDIYAELESADPRAPDRTAARP